jgi:hypothetical protein
VNSSKYLIGAVLAATAVPAAAAPVNATTNATGRALILVPLTLTKIDDLGFGTVVQPSVSGTVTVDPVTGARSFTGGVTGVPSGVVQRGYLGGAGSPNQQVVISVSAPSDLVSTSNPADKIPVLAITLDGPVIRSIDPTTRTFFFGLGGVLQINANQPEGDYEATFNVTAMYL